MFSSIKLLELEYFSTHGGDHNIEIVDEEWFNQLIKEDTNVFRRLMHMNARTFLEVCRYLKQSDSGIYYKYKNKLTYNYKVACGLSYMLQRSTVSTNARLFNISQTNYLRCVSMVKGLLLDIYKDVVKIPPKDEQYSFSSLPGCTMCLDGTHIKKCNQIENGLSFFNRKSYQSLNAQILCDESLNILYASCNFPGRCSDSFAIKSTDFFTNINSIMRTDSYILADNGYPNTKEIITPYKMYHDITDEQTTYNFWHSHNRIKIENVNAALKNRCKSLVTSHNRLPEDCQKNFYTCVCLHQLCNQIEKGVRTGELTTLPAYDGIVDTRKKLVKYIISNFLSVSVEKAKERRTTNTNNSNDI